jgi:hypothetical protein
MDFERATSGLSGLDRILDDLRLGDNVVWQVDSVDDYRYFVSPFAVRALKDGKRLVYFRFGHHPEVTSSLEGVQVYEIEAKLGFEHFSSAIREIITREGEGVYYIFDCLSELLFEWSTDLMISNFFLVTCPYLFQLKTIAYFSVLRERHSYQTIARIRDTTQLLLDLYHKDRFYLHPLKVWKRYSPTMFLPHVAEGDDLVPLTNSTDVAELFASYPQRGLSNAERKLDYWDHIFIRAIDLTRQADDGDRGVRKQQKAVFEQLLQMMIGRDEKILTLAKKYLSIEDLLKVKTRLIGSGFIGGKAVGLLLARGILESDFKKDWSLLLEPHDSFYIGSDVYYTYLVENGCWQLRQEQKKPEKYFSAAVQLKEKLAGGIFPEMVREQFIEMLEYFGQSPIIVRSSSLLEDGFGNAFAGKYESVFCANQGNLQERYEQFIRAVRKIYASTMNEDALVYRLQRGLDQSDEQMALLVQRVSGSHHGLFFFPDLAGVALSHNLYVWRENMDPSAGMLRLVLGLGTRAVDRLDDDYARFVALDHPLLRPDSNLEEQITYTQHGVDVLDLPENALRTVPFLELASQNLIQHLSTFATRDWGNYPEERTINWFLSFETLLGQTGFPKVMRDLLQTLQSAYGYPVDTEFTANFRQDGSFHVNLLQCRPLQGKCNQKRVAIPENIPEEQIIFLTTGKFMGGSLELRVKRVIYTDPGRYSSLMISDKYQIARLIGRLNGLTASQEETPTILLGPGRWGTSTPSLGIPVSFAEINKFAVLGEIAFKTGGFSPELSYGTHFFQDLVEIGIFYLALNENETQTKFNHDFFNGRNNELTNLLPDAERWRDVVRVIDVADQDDEIWLHADLSQQKVLCWRR